jgi:hypothetical protein
MSQPEVLRMTRVTLDPSREQVALPSTTSITQVQDSMNMVNLRKFRLKPNLIIFCSWFLILSSSR